MNIVGGGHSVRRSADTGRFDAVRVQTQGFEDRGYERIERKFCPAPAQDVNQCEMPVFESERSGGLAGEYLSTNVSSDVFLERLKSPLLGYIVTLEERPYDFFVSICGCRCQRSETGEFILGRCGDAICEEVVDYPELAIYYRLDEKGVAAVVMLPTFGDHLARREGGGMTMQGVVANGHKVFAEIDGLSNAVRYNLWFVYKKPASV